MTAHSCQSRWCMETNMSNHTVHPGSNPNLQLDQRKGKPAPSSSKREGTNGMTKPSQMNERNRAAKPQSSKVSTQPTPAVDTDNARTPRQAAKGDDSVMSQPPPKQQQQALPSTDELKGKWKQQVGAAKIAWGKLTEDELLRLEGHELKLAGLVQERYAVTRDEADRQVREFFAKNRH